MNDEIVLVSAFFDIDRKNFEAIPRSNDKYFEYFEHWCRLKNRLIIFTSEDFRERVISIREKFGLGGRTEVVVVDDVSSLEPSFFSSMKNVSSNQAFSDFRLINNATSNIAFYSYIMFLKNYFLKTAKDTFSLEGQIAWIDFGFNHGGEVLEFAEDFSFEWRHQFPKKITLFYLDKIESRPIFEVVRDLKDCIMGCVYVLDASLCDDLWCMTKASMSSLLDVGLIDDDQLVLLMCYRRKTELFNMVQSNWFLPLKDFGNPNFRVRKRASSASSDLLRRVKSGWTKRNRVYAYLKRTKRALLK